MTVRRLLPALLLTAALGSTLGCSSATPATQDDGGVQACNDEGVYLAIYGKAKQDLMAGSTANLKVILTTRGSGHVAGGYVANKEVHYQLGATAPSDFELLADSSLSGEDGIATVQVRAGTTSADGVQVTASTGSCNVTFSLDVMKPARRLRFLPPNMPERDAFTSTRITLTAQATSDNGAALPGETVTFSLGSGATSSMVMRTMDDASQGTMLEATTGTDGRASVRLDTGSETTSVLIRADMSETAGDSITLRVQLKGGGSGCTGDFDCPVGQICDTTASLCVEVQSGDCQTDNDCTSPAQCIAGKCLPPDTNGQPCSCSLATNSCVGCPGGQVCIAGYCTTPPGACTSNADCPVGWECRNGQCQPDYPCSQGCPTGWVCEAGQCQPPGGDCPISPRPTDRLEATWGFESMLHLRDGVNSIFAGFLTVAGYLQQIINGGFSIGGIPSWISDIIEDFIKDLIDEYVPPWGLELIQALSDINEILDDMHVWSTVQITNWSPDLYRASEKWDLIGFKWHGQDIQADPADIPEIGQVSIDDYAVREVCGVFYADSHTVHNAVGQLVRWAVEVALTAATCSGSGPCYTSIQEALEDTIDCQAIGDGVNDLLQGLIDSAPDVSDLVNTACEGLRTQLINKLVQTLNDIVVKLSVFKLRGQALIQGNSSAPTKLGVTLTTDPGHWYGSMGFLGGDFNGEFVGMRQ